jgi:hypothetical protein
VSAAFAGENAANDYEDEAAEAARASRDTRRLAYFLVSTPLLAARRITPSAWRAAFAAASLSSPERAVRAALIAVFNPPRMRRLRERRFRSWRARFFADL